MEHHKKKSGLERIENYEHKYERKVEKKVMENKNLVIAIGVVFVLVIIIGGYVLFNGEDKVPESSSTVSSLVTTCDDWCANEQLSDWCDFELSADTGRGSCYGFANSPLYTQLGVKKCSVIDCNNRPEVDNTCAEGLGGVWDTPNSNGECDPVNGITRFVVTSTDEPPVAGQVCCVE